MTREEAKEVFLNRGFINGIYDGDKWREACIVISKWLEQEPTTKNDLAVDCISREQALVAIRNLYPDMPRVDFNGSLRKWVDKYKPYIECDDAIKQLPSATPQEPIISDNGVKDELNRVKDELEPTTKNGISHRTIIYTASDCISRQAVIDMTGLSEWFDSSDSYNEFVIALSKLPSVTPQLSSGLEKNSKKLEKDFGELDCISREQALRELKESAEHHANDSREETLLRRDRDIIRALPSVTPQEPRWIPVSERLPKPYMFVNATCRSLVDDREDWVVETIYLPIPKEHNPRHYSNWGNIPMLNWGEAEVIAWVERIIPQPYKAESEPQESEDKE